MVTPPPVAQGRRNGFTWMKHYNLQIHTCSQKKHLSVIEQNYHISVTWQLGEMTRWRVYMLELLVTQTRKNLLANVQEVGMVCLQLLPFVCKLVWIMLISSMSIWWCMMQYIIVTLTAAVGQETECNCSWRNGKPVDTWILVWRCSLLCYGEGIFMYPTPLLYAATICCVSEKDTLFAFLQSTQLTNEYQKETLSWRELVQCCKLFWKHALKKQRIFKETKCRRAQQQDTLLTKFIEKVGGEKICTEYGNATHSDA